MFLQLDLNITILIIKKKILSDIEESILITSIIIIEKVILFSVFF